MFLWRASFVHVGSAYRHTMIGGLFGVVKGGFSGICRRTHDGGIPAYAGMTAGGVGMTCPPLKSHTRPTNAIRTGRLSIGSACDTLRCIHRSLGFG